MRSAAELKFRVSQELANLSLWLLQPSVTQAAPTPLPVLPDPMSVAEALKRTAFAANVRELAETLLRGGIPVSGRVLDTGAQVRWRRDYVNDIESERRYFRRVPYLTFSQVGDHKTVWDLNRHQHLVALAQAVLLTENESYIDVIERHVLSWTDDNPFMEGINWTSALEVAFRALSWAWTYHLVGSRLRDSTAQVLLNGLYRHARYLDANLSVYFSPNTHLLGEAVALHAIGVLFPRFPQAGTWKRNGARVVADEMMRQVREDGTHFEQSSYYHVYALDMFAFHAVLETVTASYMQRLAKMAEYLDALMGSGGVLPLIGDDDGGRFFHPYGPCDRFGRATLATCSVLMRDADWAIDEAALPEQAAWWLGPEALQSSGRPQRLRASKLYPNAGVALMCSADTQVIADGGPFGFATGGHSHSDTLSMVIRRGAEEILVDAGTFTYVGDADQRNWFRGSQAHNTIRIDRADQATPAGPFRWTALPQVRVGRWEPTAERDWFEASWQHARQHLEHRRTLLLLKQGHGVPCDVLICADLVSGDGDSHEIEQLWHPGEPIERESATDLRIGSDTHLVLPEGTLAELSEGWRSRSFGEKFVAPVLTVRRQSRLPAVFWAVLTFGQSHVRRLTVTEPSRANLQLDGACSIALSIDPERVPWVDLQSAAG